VTREREDLIDKAVLPPPVNRLPPHARIAIVAGEASGDLLGSLLIDAVHQANLADSFYGIAGSRMQAAGAKSLYPMDALSVRGYVEALGSLGKILAIRRDLRRRLLADPPQLFVGVDAPDFNLALEARLKRAGISTVHFVSPSIWAWRARRIEKLRRATNHVLLVFPFEEALFRQAGIPATYVGHPLAHALPERDRDGTRLRLQLPLEPEYVALLPGSRPSELKAHGRLFIEAAKLLYARRPNLRFLVPIVNLPCRQSFEHALAEADAYDLPIRMMFGHAHDALQAADAALIASGTATLEALLLDCPHVITYRMPRLSYWLMRRQALQPWVGLPNILAQRTVVPEILQAAATPEALMQALEALLGNESARHAQTEEFEVQRTRLRRDTPRLIAQALQPFLGIRD